MLLKHSFLYLFARGIPGVINFLAIAVYTRLLLPDEYGQYALVIAWVGLGYAVLFQWMRLGLARFLPGYQEKNRSSLLATILVAFLAIALFTGFIGLFITIFLPGIKLRGLLLLGYCLLVIQAWYELNLTLLSSQLKPIYYGLVSFSKAGLALLLGWCLAVNGFGAAGLILGLSVGFLIPALWTTWREWRGVNISDYDLAILKKLLLYGLPLTVTFALNFVVSSSDRIMLGWLQGPDATGLYAVGYDLAQQTLVMLMMVVNLAAYPLAVWSLEQKGVHAARQQLKQNCTLLLAIAMPATAGLAILAPNLAHVILGQSFSTAAGEIIPIITLGAFMMGLKAYYFDLSFQLGKHTQGQVWVALVTACINLILNMCWIPKFGIHGAAYATFLSYTVGLILSILLGRSIFPLSIPVADATRLAMATGVMCLALWPVKHFIGVSALAGQILLGIITYGVLLISFNILTCRSKINALISRLYRHVFCR